MEAPKLLEVHPGCRIMVKFALNTPVMDQSKQSIFIYNYDCKSKE
jgi:hypothetical protein